MLQVGQDLEGGRYKVLQFLGRGGLAEVWAVEDAQLSRGLALKVPITPAAPSTLDLFRGEAKSAAMAARLSDRFPEIYDLGELTIQGLAYPLPYFTMEWLAGLSLQKILDNRGQFDPQLTIRYVWEACEALAHAHKGDIVHLDIKPENLFLSMSPDGFRLRVLDLGLSKLKATISQFPIGTPGYMAPEQCQVDFPVSPQMDVWALGISLYELLTGKLPFAIDSSNWTETATKAAQPYPPASDLVHNTPSGLDAVIARCLAVRPEDRWTDAGQLAGALKPLLADRRSGTERRSRATDGSAPTVSNRWAVWKFVGTASGGFALGAASVSLLWLRHDSQHPIVPPPLASATVTNSGDNAATSQKPNLDAPNGSAAQGSTVKSSAPSGKGKRVTTTSASASSSASAASSASTSTSTNSSRCVSNEGADSVTQARCLLASSQIACEKIAACKWVQ